MQNTAIRGSYYLDENAGRYMAQTYPEQSIRQTLTNLVKQGPEGLREAKDAVSAWLKSGNELPAKWLRELRKDLQSF